MILVFGHSGQVAKELGAFEDIVTLNRHQADLSNPKSCRDAILKYNPDAVINAAAYTDVDKAEDEEELATLINADAPICMANTCAEVGIPFVHISTDYVFEGIGEDPWLPSDKTNPKNAYGRSKLAGEKGVIASSAIYVILRCSWIISAHGKNFIKTILKLSKSTERLSVINDQIGAPTPAFDVANACYKIVMELLNDSKKSGIYHFSGMPYVSWYDFAKEIFIQAKLNIDLIPINSVYYNSKAKRPNNSRLDCSDIKEKFDIELPDWRNSLKLIIKDLENIS